MYRHCTTVPLYVGIDIGKNVHCFGGFEGPRCEPCGPAQTVHSTRRGYDQFRVWLDESIASAQYGPVLVGMEPTGIYHEHWAYALAEDYAGQIDLRFVNPYQTKNCRKQITNGRRRKSDALDVEAIAYCLRSGLGHPARLAQGPAFRFSTWAAAYRRTFRDRQRLQNSLLALLDRIWPGALVNVRDFRKAHPGMAEPDPLIKSDPLQRDMVRILIEFAPDPYEWRSWSLEDICAFFHSHDYPCGDVKSNRMHYVAHDAMLLPSDLIHDLLDYLNLGWQRYQLLSLELERLREMVKQLVPGTPAAVLTTVPGIGEFLAAGYVAYVLDAARFRRADEIWSLAGFDVEQEESGDASYRGEISRRGNPGFRNILYSIGFETSQRCPALQRTKQHARQRGLGPVGAVVHVAHRANRICFRLLRDQVPYDPKFMK